MTTNESDRDFAWMFVFASQAELCPVPWLMHAYYHPEAQHKHTHDDVLHSHKNEHLASFYLRHNGKGTGLAF